MEFRIVLDPPRSALDERCPITATNGLVRAALEDAGLRIREVAPALILHDRPPRGTRSSRPPTRKVPAPVQEPPKPKARGRRPSAAPPPKAPAPPKRERPRSPLGLPPIERRPIDHDAIRRQQAEDGEERRDGKL